MHSDMAAIQKSIATYYKIGAALLVFTGITVAASYFNLAIPAAITLAMIIAATKGSMVVAVFMHLSHERRWIYGALLLTIVGFIVLMTVPMFTIMDTIGTPTHVAAPGGEHAGH
jgi:caa(3)-type oxidase subunit IV